MLLLKKIENIYIQSKWVAQAFVYGNSLEHMLVGIIVPDEEVLEAYCKINRIDGSFKDWCKNIVIRKIIGTSLTEIADQNKLHSFERIAAFHLHPELFSTENGILTPTFKLKRSVAKKHFENVISDLYQQAKNQLRSKI